MNNSKEKGFTLIELLLSMAFFSFILLFVTTGFIIVNRSYNKGLTVKLVQDEARRVVEDLSRDIRVTSVEGVAVDSSVSCLALGDNRYYWSVPIDSSDSDSPTRLIKERGATCADAFSLVNPGGEDLLNDRVGVQFMEVTPLPGATGTFSINLVLSTSSTDLVENPRSSAAQCTTGSGNQYCDVVQMTTVVSSR